ncbi:3-hydroxyacyl-CoA dehydrogenase NAD-binding domain-containing protein [Peribacillus loiseleuriae]|uniref:3-hydroxyacyl-CoA dehydrogenase NAD-binding domain-containing protein n=1 Tax=Peribacillus loiseleuriae TaxID=1679170 RepID=UPI00247FC4CE|nr:3-hydroxyacyl-CoA dehydrogenase NAD-binding domain-containing protein [Peribacillus loiseleuriae]
MIELKWNLYQELALLIKSEAIIASDTSTYSISRLVGKTSFAERMIITHSFL